MSIRINYAPMNNAPTTAESVGGRMNIKTGLEYIGAIDPWTDEERLTDEEIVRCRDCRFSLAHGNGCGRNQDIYDVEPDGFCKWGERRDA